MSRAEFDRAMGLDAAQVADQLDRLSAGHLTRAEYFRRRALLARQRQLELGIT